jgi:hypothetical protein
MESRHKDKVNCHDIARVFTVLLNLVSQMRDINMDIIHASGVFPTPNVGQDLVKSKYLPCITCQINQQPEFNGG